MACPVLPAAPSPQNSPPPGKLRVNREVVRKSGYTVKPGDVLTFPKGKDIRVIEIVGLGERRGPAAEAQTLYRDLSPPQPKQRTEAVAKRDQGAGRPTKNERRAIRKAEEPLAEACSAAPKNEAKVIRGISIAIASSSPISRPTASTASMSRTPHSGF